MKHLRWQFLIAAVSLAAIAVLLFSQKPVTETRVEAPEPVVGGAYTEALLGSFSRFNPVLDFYNPADRDVDRLIFSRLLQFDANGLPQPDLAESWGISRDGKIYNVSLNPEARWHDGEPVTAADVVFTISLLRSPELPIPDDLLRLWEGVDVEAMDARTLQFRLPEPHAPFLDYLTFGVLPVHLLGGLSVEELIDAPFNLTPVGSGPYRFRRMMVEGGAITGVSLVAFEAYHGGRPFIDEINFRYYADEAAALAAYEAGEVQGVSAITPKSFESLSAGGGVTFYSGRLPQLTIILLNLDDPNVPFLREAEVRRALLMGVNRQRLINRVLEGQAMIADGPVLPQTWAYYDGLPRVPYDPDQAVALLKAAGYTIPAAGGAVRANEAGEPLRLNLAHPNTPEHTALAELIRRDWLALGVDVNLIPVSYSDLIQRYLEPRLYQAALVDLSLSSTPDPDPYPFWHQTQATGGQNYAMWNDRQASEYLEQARIVVDPAERARLYRNFQIRFAHELPSLPLYHPVYTYAVSSEVRGVRMGPLFERSDRFATLTSWYLFFEMGAGTAETPVP